MKQKHFALIILFLLMFMFSLFRANDCFAFSRGKETSIGIGAHYHIALSDLDHTDFDGSHLSYLTGMKFKFNYKWTLDAVIEYYPGKDDISYILSPRISLLYGKGFYFGTGIEKKYVKLESGESNWNDETYFAQTGLEMPFGSNNTLNIDAYYGLEKLSDVTDIISDFDSDNLTFGISLYHYF